MQPNNLDPLQTPTSDDNQPNIPPPPQTSSFGGRVLQPVSSEDDIRAELGAATVTSVKPAEQPIVALEEPSLNSYGIATEPIQRLDQAPISPSTQSYRVSQATMEISPSDEQKKSHKGLIIFLSLLGMVILGLAIAYFMIAMRGKISVNDLVETKTGTTTYLRPKQWQSIAGDTNGYRDGVDKYGKSTALVSVNANLMQIPAAAMATKSALDNYRTIVLESSSVTSGTASPTMCGAGTDVKKEADTSSTATTEGIYQATSTCHRDDKTFVLHTRVVVGHDGNARLMLIMATQSSWDKNKGVFQKMLDSLQQSTL